MTTPAISVVLPTYNVENYIARALDSLIKQTYTEFEVIVVDDCGHDNSIKIAEDYALRDDRIKIIKNPKNLGTYHARRVGVEHAEGSYIVFLDPDDELAENCIKYIYEFFVRDESDVVFFDVSYNPLKKWYMKEMKVFPERNATSLIQSYFTSIRDNYSFGTPGKAFSRKILLEAYSSLDIDYSFRFVFSEDTCLLVYIFMTNPKYSVLRYKGYIYYSNPTSITMQSPIKMKENILQYDFMLTKIIKSSMKLKLSPSDKKTFSLLLRKFQSEKQLFLRHSGGKTDYFRHMFKAWCLVPTLSKSIRIFIFIVTLGIIRL